MGELDQRRRVEALFSEHSAAVRAYARRRVPSATADDVVSDVFVVAWRRLDDVPHDGLPWLLACAQRIIANQRRSVRRQAALRDRLTHERAPAPGGQAIADSALAEALATLSKSDREVLMLTAAQRISARRLGGRVGAVVAVDPRTGAIRVMYGNSARDGGDPAAAAGAAAVLGATARDQYSPGAAFEIVTTAAALDTGRYAPSSLIVGRSPLTVSGVSIRNDLNQSFGQISLARALSYSVNTVFAQVGAAVGPMQMTAYMRRLGFYSSPQLGSAGDRVSASGMRLAGRFVLPGTVGTSLGRLAIGQAGLTATPLQMAMVASAAADDGMLMTPRLRTGAPTVDVRAMKRSTARTLAQMLRQVVEQGTATPADHRGWRSPARPRRSAPPSGAPTAMTCGSSASPRPTTRGSRSRSCSRVSRPALAAPRRRRSPPR